MPTYDYWVGRYEYNNRKQSVLSQFYIMMIWVLFAMQVLISVIFFLNYLIAIVSESFNTIITNEEIAVLKGRDDLNGANFCSKLIRKNL